MLMVHKAFIPTVGKVFRRLPSSERRARDGVDSIVEWCTTVGCRTRDSTLHPLAAFSSSSSSSQSDAMFQVPGASVGRETRSDVHR